MINVTTQHFRLANLAALALFLGACAERGPVLDIGVSLELAQHRSAIISEINYDLRLSVPEDQFADISGRLSLSFNLSENDAPLQLDFRESADHIISVIANGRETAYRFEKEHIIIPAGETNVGANLVEIEFIAGSTSLNRNPEFLYTLFVPDRARTAFPLFDQPDLKATYDLTLTIPGAWTAMSNAPVESVTEYDTDTEFRFVTTDLISSYLFSFVAGKFATVERDIAGRSMVMIHRETDEDKIARNIDAIFELHAAALDWLEDYTGIDYPYQKFGFALIPSFQYGGMEHVGAIQYRAASLFLDEAPSEPRLLGRAGLISHETAHMWFGNLVTMEWFNDVWTKEVFANFMAAKIVNPGFPNINHDLNFLVRHYPGAYSVDRTTGANPIRQYLPNLNGAGQMYGAIIYNKAPIMMRQLEIMIGEDVFREGMQEYLTEFAFSNATWPALVSILDGKSTEDLRAWSEVWVNTPGRPTIEIRTAMTGSDQFTLQQRDTDGGDRVWPQRFGISAIAEGNARYAFPVSSSAGQTPLDLSALPEGSEIVFNSDGLGYGLFPSAFEVLGLWDALDDVEKGSVLISLYENLLDGLNVRPAEYFTALSDIITDEQNQLILNLALGQIRRIYWNLLPATARDTLGPTLENALWQTMVQQSESSRKKIFFETFAAVAISPDAVRKLYAVWSGSLMIEGLPLSENDHIDLAQILAIKMPGQADEIINTQMAKTRNPDNQRKLTFIGPSLSADQAVRDRFFASLANEENRATESWVLDALENIHHPLRVAESEQYLLPSLEMLQEIQMTGDIFFPKRWLDVSLGNYRSETAVHTVRTFLDERPDYDEQLKMKILQSADMMFRANILIGPGP